MAIVDEYGIAITKVKMLEEALEAIVDVTGNTVAKALYEQYIEKSEALEEFHRVRGLIK